MTSDRRTALFRLGIFIVGMTVLLIALDHWTHGAFLRPFNVSNVLKQIAVYAVLAVGQTLVIITAGIDLSVGSLIALTGVLMAGVMVGQASDAVGLLVAIAAGVGVGGLAGVVNGWPVVKFNLPPFITTLAMMLMARGLAFLYSGGRPIEIDNAAFNAIGGGTLFPGLGHLIGLPGIPAPVLVMLAVVIAGHFVLTRTRFGRYVYAIGGNEEAARLSGINVAGVKMGVYIIS